MDWSITISLALFGGYMVLRTQMEMMRISRGRPDSVQLPAPKSQLATHTEAADALWASLGDNVRDDSIRRSMLEAGYVDPATEPKVLVSEGGTYGQVQLNLGRRISVYEYQALCAERELDSMVDAYVRAMDKPQLHPYGVDQIYGSFDPILPPEPPEPDLRLLYKIEE